MITLVLGGARSGKSAFAQRLIAPEQPAVYIATAAPDDPEMQKRVARHRRDRPTHWATLEAPIDLASAIDTHRRGAETAGHRARRPVGDRFR
jgi:adenosylcobinamide kinase/adenosylcobinamide-phosphate guanylyltransferase